MDTDNKTRTHVCTELVGSHFPEYIFLCEVHESKTFLHTLKIWGYGTGMMFFKDELGNLENFTVLKK
jgi:hypothetical protein